MFLIGVTLVLIVAWHVFVGGMLEAPLSTRVVLVGVGATGQIVVTLTFLGALGLLAPVVVVLVNVTVCACLAAVPLRFGAAFRLPGPAQSLAVLLRDDLRAIVKGGRAALGWDTGAFVVILVFAAAWLATVIAYYPPRGIDDLVYHLPPVYQAAQEHRISILPLELRNLFAFPLAGEMTFLWVVLLDGSIRWVDSVQAVFALFGMAAVFALGRRFGLSARGSAFAACLFGTMPVVLLQATSNYVDIISNVWLLGAAVTLLAYEASGSRLSLALGGLATGLLLGSKYQGVLFTLALASMAAALIRAQARAGQGFVRGTEGTAPALGSKDTTRARGSEGSGRARSRKDTHTPAGRTGLGRTLARHGSLFALPAVAAGGYWYVRNLLLFSNPFYPLPIRILGMTIFPGPFQQGVSTWSALASDPAEALRIAAWDPGLGSFHGGFGFLFWGFAAPAFAYVFLELFRQRRSSGNGKLFVLALIPIGIATLFLAPHDQLWLTPRYVLAVGGIGAVAVARLGEEAAVRGTGAATLLRGIAVAGALLALPVAAPAVWPLVSLAPVAADAPEIRAAGELRYLEATAWDLRTMASAWAPLDAMTRGGGGLTVYQASDYSVFWTGPTYGVELQNRIWNFEKAPALKPDAFFFHSPRGTPFFVGRKIERKDVAADQDYRLVASNGDDATTLYVLRTALTEHGRLARLADYYGRTERANVVETAASAATMEEGSVVLPFFPLAAGYFVHKADGRLRAEVDPITTKDLASAPARWPGRAIYTFGAAVPGAVSRPVGEISVRDGKVTIMRNEPVPRSAPTEGGAR